MALCPYQWQLPVLLSLWHALVARGSCPAGVLPIQGGVPVRLTSATWNVPGDAARTAQLAGNIVVAPLKSRSYFSDTCNEGSYWHEQYRGMSLLGKTLRYTTDLQGAGCGCNAALYLISLKQNSNPSSCKDYYCDANSVCGVSCTEVDIQEANQRAWRSTLHSHNDSTGSGAGFGGSGPHHRVFTADEYGPGANCIDTNEPFDVAASFPLDSSGMLRAMEVELSQPGKTCPLFMSLGKYIGLREIYAALSSGMTPVISYWRSKTMGWLDGAGPDGLDCGIERPGQCRESVKFYGFSLSDYVPRPAPTPAPQVFATPAPNPWGQPVSQPQPAWVPSLRAPATPVPTPAPQPAVAPSMKMLPGAYPWAEVTRDGSVYYYNVVTQEVTWTLPGAIFT